MCYYRQTRRDASLSPKEGVAVAVVTALRRGLGGGSCQSMTFVSGLLRDYLAKLKRITLVVLRPHDYRLFTVFFNFQTC